MKPVTLNSAMISGAAVCGRDISDQVDIDHEQHEIGRVKLPQPPEDAGRGHDESTFQHHLSVDDRRGIAADEHEQVSRAAESEISQRQRN